MDLKWMIFFRNALGRANFVVTCFGFGFGCVYLHTTARPSENLGTTANDEQ